MPRTTLLPTPASSTDIKGQDGSKMASLQLAFELPPPAVSSENGQNLSNTATTFYPTQASETVKSRRRSSAANPAKDQFALPPPPTRSRKIIQMKPREEAAPESTPSSSKTALKGSTAGTTTTAAGTKRKQPSATSAAGRKIARKTAHSLIERRRRSKMNEEFAVLKSLIPACTGEMHKLAILQASIEYVRYLEDCITKLKAQVGPDSKQPDAPSPHSGLPSPSIGEPYPRYPSTTTAPNANSYFPDVEMTNSSPSPSTSNTTSTAPSPSFTPLPNSNSTSRSQRPSISPALLPSDALLSRHNSYSSTVSTSTTTTTGDYRLHGYTTPSATTSPLFGPQSGGSYMDHHHHARSHSISAVSGYGSALTSPALLPQMDAGLGSTSERERDNQLDHEATAALLMLNRVDMRRRGSSNAGGSGAVPVSRGMSVRDLLSS
ncbi:hypothetical protein VTI74DRAFT_10870 [Chaetomium olivicolor]